jgi:phage RecT family recombinase
MSIEINAYLQKNSKTIASYKMLKYDDLSFRASVAMAVAESPNLAKAIQEALKTEIGQSTLMQALSKAARTGLSVAPSEGKACLIGYMSKKGPVIKYQIMKEGYVTLALDSGQVKAIRAKCVYENDSFEPIYNMGDDRPNYRPTTGDRGEMIGAFAVMQMVDGDRYMIYLTKKEIEERRDNSDGYKHDKTTSPWTTNFDAMGEKTAIKDLLRKTKTAALHSTQKLISEDADIGTPRDITPKKGASTDDVKQKLKNQNTPKDDQKPPNADKSGKQLFED